MTRLAFCFLSNNLEKLYKMEKNFIYKNKDSCIDSFTVNVLVNPPVKNGYFHPKWKTKWTRSFTDGPIDYFTLRQESLDMANHADLIYIGDDDFSFKEGSTEIINECCQYMINNLYCGAIYLGGKFGGEGAQRGDKIFIANKGSLGTNRGIILRNTGRDWLMDNNMHALGACEDATIAFSMLKNGYYIARRLNVSSIDSVSLGVISEDNENINYNLQFIKEKGIRYKVGQYIGTWDSRTEWPENIWSMYVDECAFFKRKAFYDRMGNIL
jgi:hypothetical protein